MIAQIPFWQRKRLSDMSAEEWESLCDGCGKCCLQKLEDDENGDVYYTDLACRFLDLQACRCTVYAERTRREPNCLTLTPDNISEVYWLPLTCAYRLIHEGRPLPEWHPLISGDPDSVHRAHASMAGKAVPVDGVPEDEWETHIIQWKL
ncbi:MAG: YcgN family cysteine cluster protein [Gammaproteobacteria bacterium]|nr:YcgN family cysteine cluster protein [Gammaproteobacteria bacterium]